MTFVESSVTATREISTQPMHGAQPVAYLERSTPQQILRWAVDTFAPNLVMTSAFGLNGVVLIHMLQEINREIPIVFIDTGYLFEETLETKHRIVSTYGMNILTYRSPVSVDEQSGQYGPDFPIRRPDLCCALRKVEPLQRAIAELGPIAMLNGRARFQANTRQGLPIVEWGRTPICINPLAFWSRRQVETYAKTWDVPYNPLHDMGYPSIGCWPCTRPVLDGEHIRAGRWAGLGKTECGLWTTDYAVTG